MTVQKIRVKDIVESPLNPRKTFAGLDELKASIKSVGLLQPLVVRLHGALGYECVCGHRRLRALIELGIAEVLADVRELSDVEAIEAMLVENGSREEVPPLEEGEAFSQLQKLGLDVDEIAERVGKTKAHVYGRLRLRRMTPAAQEALAKGLILVSVAQLIARLDEALQDEATQLILDSTDGYEDDPRPMSVKEAQRLLDGRVLRDLSRAPFDVADPHLSAAGACTTCPKRSGAQGSLFGDLSAKDLCADRECFAAKVELGWAKKRAEAEADGVRVIDGKDADQLIRRDYRGNACTAWDSPYRALHEDLEDWEPEEWRDLEGRRDVDEDELPPPTVARALELLGDKAPPKVLAKTSAGDLVELIEEEALLRALADAGQSVLGEALAAADADESHAERRKKEEERRKKEQEKRQREAEVGERLMARLTRDLVRSFEDDLEDEDGRVRWMISALCADAGWFGFDKVVERRGLVFEQGQTARDVISAYADELTTEAARALLAEILLPEAWGRNVDVYVELAKAREIDVAEAKREVKKELAAERKAAKAAAKAKGKPKKGKAKAGDEAAA